MNISKKGISFLFALTLGVAGFGQTDLEKLLEIENGFINIDNAVLLMEEIPSLGLKDSIASIQGLTISNPSYGAELFKLTSWLKSCHNKNPAGKNKFGHIVSIHVKEKLSNFQPFPNSYYNKGIIQLYHHAERLFAYVIEVNDKVFDENLVNIYYQFRNLLRQFIETEKMKDELTKEINDLGMEVSRLNYAIGSLNKLVNEQTELIYLLKNTTTTTRQLSEDQQRDERVSQLVTRRKWRYLAATKISKQQLDGITYGKDRKAARKDLKKALK